jgi:hypothetical protein
MQAAHTDESVSSTDQGRTAAQGSHVSGDRLLAQLSSQLAALQKSQTEAASSSDMHSLQKQGAPVLMPPRCSYCSRPAGLWQPGVHCGTLSSRPAYLQECVCKNLEWCSQVQVNKGCCI